MTPKKVLLLHSVDGQEYVRALLYPSEWSEEDADDRAVAVFAEAQLANPDEWSWEDYEPLLESAGFEIPLWHHGPSWDAGR